MPILHGVYVHKNFVGEPIFARVAQQHATATCGDAAMLFLVMLRCCCWSQLPHRFPHVHQLSHTVLVRVEVAFSGAAILLPHSLFCVVRFSAEVSEANTALAATPDASALENHRGSFACSLRFISPCPPS